MVKEINKTTTLTGASGTKYVFSLWTFDDFNDVKGSFKGAGLYLFTRRYKLNDAFRHTYLYVGETGDYSTRFNNHHKEESIRNNNGNCVGFLSMPNSTEEDRKTIENDLLASYNLPCNSINN